MKLDRSQIFGKGWEDVIAMGKENYYSTLHAIKAEWTDDDIPWFDVYEHFLNQSLVVKITAYINGFGSSPTQCKILYYNCDYAEASKLACDLREETGDREIITIDCWDEFLNE